MNKKFISLRSEFLRCVDKRVRYIHHIFVIKNYLKQNIIPKGFRIKFHSNIGPPDLFNKISHNSSIKVMLKTVNFYTKELKNISSKANHCFQCIDSEFPQFISLVCNQMQAKMALLNSKLIKTHFKKFMLDNVDFSKISVRSIFEPMYGKIFPVHTCEKVTLTIDNVDVDLAINDEIPIILSKSGSVFESLDTECRVTTNTPNSIQSTLHPIGSEDDIVNPLMDLSGQENTTLSENLYSLDTSVHSDLDSNLIDNSLVDILASLAQPSEYDTISQPLNSSTTSLSGVDDNTSQCLLTDMPITKLSDLSKNELKSTILEKFQIPPYEPIILSKSMDIPSDFISLCKKGPSFVPTSQHVDWLQIQKDFDNFCNTMRRAINEYDPKSDPHAISSAPADDLVRPPCKPKFSRIAKCNNKAVEVFLDCVKTDIFADTSYKPPKFNLSKPERDAMKWWQSQILQNKDSTVCIRLQDKGTRFVIVDKAEDILKAEAQISRSSFDKVNIDLTGKHIQQVKAWADKWLKREKISQSWYNFIVNHNAIPGKNSTLYKTHKTNIPVRLLTTGCNTAIENLCSFIEAHTYPLAENIPSRIRDTNHLLEIIDDINETPLPEDAMLVSFDIVNMFPSISNEQGIACVKKALATRKSKKPPSECILEALKISLTCNNSQFNGQHLLQTDGTAQGAKNSCSYADLATVHIDEKINQARKRKFSELSVYKKYRDDVFSIWIGDPFRLDDFLDFINTLDKNLKFTLEIGLLLKPVFSTDVNDLSLFITSYILKSDCIIIKSLKFEVIDDGIFTMWTDRISKIELLMSSVNALHPTKRFTPIIGKHKLRFLDLEILLKNHHLAHTVYRKPTNSQMYLDFSSCHPPGCKKGIAKGVALRLRRICSSTPEYIKQAKLFMGALVARGHDPSIVYSEFDKILKTPRSATRLKRSDKDISKTMFITNYNPNAPNISNILSKNMHILKSDPIATKLFPSISTVFKRNKNLKECILRADPFSVREKSVDLYYGTKHCGKSCDLCESLTHGDKFTSFATGRVFNIRKCINCNSKYVIYLFHCSNCESQGVGSTNAMKKRWSNYKSHCNKMKNTCSISRHFNEVCRCAANPVNFMKIQLIDCLDNVEHLTPDEADCLLLEKEKFWIGTLITMQKGMISTHDWYRKTRSGGEDFESEYN